MVIFHCSATDEGHIPERKTREKIQRQVAKSSHANLIVYTNAEKTTQIWQWAGREHGKPITRREYRYDHRQSGELLIQKLRAIVFTFEEEDRLTHPDVTERVGAGLLR